MVRARGRAAAAIGSSDHDRGCGGRLEHEAHGDLDPAHRKRYLERLDWIEAKVNSTWPPLSFVEERYALLAHIRAVRQEMTPQAEHGERRET